MSVELASLALKKMLTSIDASKQSFLLSMLPTDQRSSIEKTPKLSEKLTDLSLKELCNKIHPSHFIKPLKALGGKDRHFLISPLREESQSYLMRHFGDEILTNHLNAELEQFTLQLLFNATFKESEKPIPFSFLPAEKLSFLAAASHDELLLLCSSLGLFDVVTEIKKIIHSATLKKLESSFNPDELSFIHQIQNYKPNPIYQDMGLKNFDGNRSVLREIVFLRGMNRLAIALLHASKFLLQHILLTLSIEEGARLKSLQMGMKDSSALTTLIDQVIFTWDKRCTRSHS